MSVPIPVFSERPKAVSTPKLRALVKYPGNIVGGTGIDVTKEHGIVTVDMDWSEFSSTSTVPTSPTSFVLTFDTVTGVYVLAPTSLVGGPDESGGGVVEQHITSAGPVTINDNTSIVRVDQTVGAPITLNMGLAINKTGPVLIVDWKGDAGTNNITIALAGTDKFPGGLTSWVIAGNNGSVLLRPIASAGYVL